MAALGKSSMQYDQELYRIYATHAKPNCETYKERLLWEKKKQNEPVIISYEKIRVMIKIFIFFMKK